MVLMVGILASFHAYSVFPIAENSGSFANVLNGFLKIFRLELLGDFELAELEGLDEQVKGKFKHGVFEGETGNFNHEKFHTWLCMELWQQRTKGLGSTNLGSCGLHMKRIICLTWPTTGGDAEIGCLPCDVVSIEEVAAVFGDHFGTHGARHGILQLSHGRLCLGQRFRSEGLPTAARASRSPAAPDGRGITYTAAIKACEMCKDWLGALELLQKMRADQLKANCFVLTALMGVFKETRFWRDAVHTFAVLQSGQVPNVVSYNAVISACERSSSWSQALDCFFEFTQVSHLFANDVTFNALISSCEKGRMFEKTLHIDKKNHLLASVFKASVSIAKVMKESSVRLDVITYSAAISACEKALQWERALELLAEMRAERVPPNRITVNAAINATTTSALITACGFGHEWELALAILSKPIPADTVAVNSCLSACARAQHWNEVLQLANDHMMALRLSPSVLTYNSLLDACVRSAEWAQGLEVLEGLGRWSLEADEVGQAILEVNGIRNSKRMLEEFRVTGQADLLIATELTQLSCVCGAITIFIPLASKHGWSFTAAGVLCAMQLR
eukprot:g25116.t1